MAVVELDFGYTEDQKKVINLLEEILNHDENLGEFQRDEFVDLYFDVEGLVLVRFAETVKVSAKLKETEESLEKFKRENIKFKEFAEKYAITELADLSHLQLVEADEVTDNTCAVEQTKALAALEALNNFVNKLESDLQNKLQLLCSEAQALIKKCFEERNQLSEQLQKSDEELEKYKLENYRYAKTLGIGIAFRTIK